MGDGEEEHATQVFKLLKRKKVVLCQLYWHLRIRADATPLPATVAQTIPVESKNAPKRIVFIIPYTDSFVTRMQHAP